MIKTINKEIIKKDKQLTKLKKQMLDLLSSVDIRSLTPNEQDILVLLDDDTKTH